MSSSSTASAQRGLTESHFARHSTPILRGPEGILYDVRTDIKVKSYLLGIYFRQCTVVTGKVGRL